MITVKINIWNFVDYQTLVYMSSTPRPRSALTQALWGSYSPQQLLENLLVFGYFGTKASDP